MSLSKEDRRNEALKVLEDVSTAYVHIHDTLHQIREGNLDVKLQFLQDQRRILSSGEDYFIRMYSERHETYTHGRDSIVWFEAKLVEGIRTAVTTLVKETLQEIENAVKAAVLK